MGTAVMAKQVFRCGVIVGIVPCSITRVGWHSTMREHIEFGLNTHHLRESRVERLQKLRIILLVVAQFDFVVTEESAHTDRHNVGVFLLQEVVR